MLIWSKNLFKTHWPHKNIFQVKSGRTPGLMLVEAAHKKWAAFFILCDQTRQMKKITRKIFGY